MGQQAHIKFKDLSERAKILTEQMLERHYLPASIARSIWRITHEPIAPEEIAQYAATHFAKKKDQEDARARASYLVTRIMQEGGEVSEMLRAAFHESYAWAKKSGALKEMNPLNFEAAERHRQELQIKQQQIALAERRVKAFEDRLRLDRKKARAAIQKLDKKARRGGAITPQEIQRIRELYGIGDPGGEEQ